MRRFPLVFATLLLSSVVYGQQAPSTVSVTASGGTSQTQTFTFAYTGDGTSKLYGWFAPAPGQYWDACVFTYDPAMNTVTLWTDEGREVRGFGSQTPGVEFPRGQNKQCILGTAAPVIVDGTHITLPITVTFMPSFLGPMKILMYADGLADWQEVGHWTATADPASPLYMVYDNLTNYSGSESYFAYSAAAGTSDLRTVWVWIKDLNGTDGEANSCLLRYDVQSGQINLRDDAGTGWISKPLVLGMVGLGNKSCYIDGYPNGGPVVDDGRILRISMRIALSERFTNQSVDKEVWMRADSSNATSGWKLEGRWQNAYNPYSPPTLSVAPQQGSGLSQTFTFWATYPPDGFQGPAASVWVFIAPPEGWDTMNGCSLNYVPGTKLLTLWDTSAYQRGHLGDDLVLDGSLCSIDLSRTTESFLDRFGLTIPVTFKPALSGPLDTWMSVDSGWPVFVGWWKVGEWTAPGGGGDDPCASASKPARAKIGDWRRAPASFSRKQGVPLPARTRDSLSRGQRQ